MVMASLRREVVCDSKNPISPRVMLGLKQSRGISALRPPNHENIAGNTLATKAPI
jgi:hypothetical protein